MTPDQLDAASTALAFVRAFAANDGAGASQMLTTLTPAEVPDFASALATFVLSALRVGDTDPGPFFDAMATLLAVRQAEK